MYSKGGGDQDMGFTLLVKHKIHIQPEARPIKQQARRLGHEKEKKVEAQVQELLEERLIEPSSSIWSSAVVLVRKE